MVECQHCTEAANGNYSIHTGRVTICRASDGGTKRDLGNIKEITLKYAPEYLEHFDGRTGQLDAKIPIRSRFSLAGILDELTPSNIAVLLGADEANTVDGCKVPFNPIGGCDASTASVEFVHTMPCGETVTIVFWRATITTEAELKFGDDFLEIPVTFEALSCASKHPTEEYGHILFSQACAVS